MIANVVILGFLIKTIRSGYKLTGNVDKEMIIALAGELKRKGLSNSEVIDIIRDVLF